MSVIRINVLLQVCCKEDDVLLGQTEDEIFPEACGFSLNNRVIGGNGTELGEFPWLAALFYSSK